MSRKHARQALMRTRWSAIGAAVAVTLGAGGLGMAQAALDTGDRPVTVTIEPVRILDTRTNLGLSGRFADATPRDLQVSGAIAITPGSGGLTNLIPPDAIGVLVNATVVSPTHDGFLSLRPQGAAGEPTTSTVNFTPGSIEPNAATVDLNDGQIQIWLETSSDSGAAHVLIDLVGYTIDHTHDDRYYTEDEVDDALADKADAADTYTETEVDDAIEAVDRVTGISFLSAPFDLVAGTEGGIPTPSCPVGQVAISGGMDYNDSLGGFDADIDMVDSYPDTANRRWIVGFRNASASTYNAIFHTVCAAVAP